MGKKHRIKNSDKTNPASVPSKLKKQLLNDVSNLFALCITTIDPHKEWEFFVNLYSAVENFRQKHNAVLNRADNKGCDRKSLIPVFNEWMQSNGATWEHVKIHNYGEEQGFGIIATSDIKAEELLVSVPRSAMITHEDIKESSYLKDLIESNKILSQMPNVCLALYLFCEAYNPSSLYKPYIDILPKVFNTTLFFTPDELQYLKGSSVLSTAINHYRSIVRQFALIFKIFHGPESRNSYVGKISSAIRESFSFDAYRWCVSAVSTRQNQIPTSKNDGGSTLALIPMWDMFNHKEGIMSTSYNISSDMLESYSMSDFKEGEQVMICYGTRTNSDLLIHNGFVIPSNPHGREVHVSFGVSQQDSLFHRKKELLERLACRVNGKYAVFSNEGELPASPQLVAFLRVFHMNQAEIGDWLEKDDEELHVISRSKIGTHAQFKNEEKICKYLEDRLKLVLMSRERTGEKDLGVLLNDESVSYRSKLSIRVEKEERKILEECIEQCKVIWNKLRSNQD